MTSLLILVFTLMAVSVFAFLILFSLFLNLSVYEQALARVLYGNANYLAY